jgi:hypothetical protein
MVDLIRINCKNILIIYSYPAPRLDIPLQIEYSSNHSRIPDAHDPIQSHHLNQIMFEQF